MARSARPPATAHPVGLNPPVQPLGSTTAGKFFTTTCVTSRGHMASFQTPARGSLLIRTHPEPVQASRWPCPGCFLHMQRRGRVTRREEGPPLRPTPPGTFVRAVRKSWYCGVSPTAAPAVPLPQAAAAPWTLSAAEGHGRCRLTRSAPPRATAWLGGSCTSPAHPSSPP